MLTAINFRISRSLLCYNHPYPHLILSYNITRQVQEKKYSTDQNNNQLEDRQNKSIILEDENTSMATSISRTQQLPGLIFLRFIRI
jgi:hypothetical protein